LRKERDFEAFSFAFQVKIQYTIIVADAFRKIFAASKAFLVGGSVADRQALRRLCGQSILILGRIHPFLFWQ